MGVTAGVTRGITRGVAAAITGMGAAAATGPVARAAAGMRLLNRMQPLDIGTATPPLQRTLDMQLTTLSAFTGVRLVYRNYSASQAMTINKAVVAGCPNLLNDGTTLTWVDVTFSGAASASVPLATGAAEDMVPGILISDEITVASVARDDAGTKTILRVRTSYTDSSNICSVASNTLNGASYVEGFNFRRSLQSINPSAIKTYDAVVADAGGSLSPDEVLFTHSSGAHYSMTVNGDSLSQSTGSDDTTAGWPQRLQFLAANEGKKFTVANYAVIGQTHAASLATAQARIAAGYVPSMAAMFGHSINSGANQAAFDASWTRVQTFVSDCLAAGITPVVCYNPPSFGVSDAIIQAQNARLAGLASTVIKLDFYTPMVSGGVLNATYDNGDGVHINPAGQLVLAGVAKSAFQAAGIWV